MTTQCQPVLADLAVGANFALCRLQEDRLVVWTSCSTAYVLRLYGPCQAS
jgi:hypothetical protein